MLVVTQLWQPVPVNPIINELRTDVKKKKRKKKENVQVVTQLWQPVPGNPIINELRTDVKKRTCWL